MRKTLLLLVCLAISTSLFAQGKEFVGKITSKGVGIAIEGAEISAKKGVKAKTSSNHEGVFYIQNVEEDFTINISHKDYIRIVKRVNLSDGYTQTFELEMDKTNDQTYKDSYGESKASKATNPTGGIEIDETTSASMTYEQVLAQLRRIPGVTVNNGEILVRGPSSINSTNAPTVVVDGVRTPEGLSGVDPTTIVKIEVLKGSAAVMYGAQGATGVILITTRNR